MNLIKKIKSILSKNELRLLNWIVVASIFLGIVEALGVALIFPFMSAVLDTEIIFENQYLLYFYKAFNFTSVNTYMATIGVVVILFLLAGNVYMAFVDAWVIKFSMMQGHRLSTRLLSNYLYQPYSFFLQRNTADLGKNILTEVQRCISGIILPVVGALSKLFIIILIFIVLVVANPFVAISILAILSVVFTMIYILVRGKLSELGVDSTKVVFDRHKAANEAMQGVKQIKLHGKEEVFVERFSIASKKNASYYAHSSIIGNIPRYVLEAVAFGSMIGIIVVLLMKGYKGVEIIPMISLYALGSYKLIPSLQSVYKAASLVTYNLPALDILIKDFENTSKNEDNDANNKQALTFKNEIELKAVTTSYKESNKTILDSLNLKIKHNTTVGIVGKTGSGKTTLIDVIMWLIEIDKGVMTVDGVLVDLSTMRSWREKIGYVPQEIYLLDDTIEKNIAFGVKSSEVNQLRIEEVCNLCELDEFIVGLPEGSKTLVGEKGVRLSGGQRQRIGIARALYNNPDILILDEATSALDSNTEDFIMRALHNLAHKKTIIMVAHRITTLKNCDVIHMIENGSIKQSGTYSELFKS